MDCSPPGSAVHGISQARILEWIAIPSSKGSSLGQEDALEEEMATHSTNLAWSISWIEEPGGLCSIGLQRVRRD